MAKKKTAIRTNISVPAPLKRRMEKVREVNWSAVAVAAFEAKLASIDQEKKGLDMESVRERLKASKEEHESDSFNQGLDDGELWAKETAEYPELKRLVKLRDKEGEQFDHLFLDHTRDGMKFHEWLASKILGKDVVDEYEARECLWEPAFGEDECENMVEDLEALKGFCYGAIDVFEAADV